MFTPPDAPFFTVFNYQIRFYGICMAIGMLCGCWMIYFASKNIFKEKNQDVLFDLFPLLILFGILGARLYYVLLNFGYFFSNPTEIIMINHGGISIHGGILGGLLSIFLFSGKHKIPFLHLCDLTSFGVIVGQIFGRWGNFFNSEAFGRPCNLIWKMFIKEQYRPIEYINFSYFHPTFLYEIIWNIFVLLCLLKISRKEENRNSQGLIFFSYLALYSMGRFLIESIRLDSILNIFGVPIPQIVSLILIFIGIFGVWKIKNKKSR